LRNTALKEVKPAGLSLAMPDIYFVVVSI